MKQLFVILSMILITTLLSFRFAVVITDCSHLVTGDALSVISFVLFFLFIGYLNLKYEYRSSKWPNPFERWTSFVQNSYECVSKIAATLAY